VSPGPTDTVPPMTDHGRRASYWTRWPDENTGPLWAGIHFHERAGATAIIGVELYSEPPGDARMHRGPFAEDLAADMAPTAPTALRAADLEGLSITELLDRFRATGPEAQGLAGAPGTRVKRYGPDHWERVATFYRTFMNLGGRGGVANAIAANWTVSAPTAKKWIARAREVGALEPFAVPEPAEETAAP
jgi:hypothetical protein